MKAGAARAIAAAGTGSYTMSFASLEELQNDTIVQYGISGAIMLSINAQALRFNTKKTLKGKYINQVVQFWCKKKDIVYVMSKNLVSSQVLEWLLNTAAGRANTYRHTIYFKAAQTIQGLCSGTHRNEACPHWPKLSLRTKSNIPESMVKNLTPIFSEAWNTTNPQRFWAKCFCTGVWRYITAKDVWALANGNPNPDLHTILEERRNTCIQTMRQYKAGLEAGNPSSKQLETIVGFHPVYNDMFWIVAHSIYPFNWAKHGINQGAAKSVKDFVVQHPLVLSGGNTDLDEYTMDPKWPHWCAILDIAVQQAFCQAPFLSDSMGGHVKADSQGELDRFAIFESCKEEHTLAMEVAASATLCVDWVLKTGESGEYTNLGYLSAVLCKECGFDTDSTDQTGTLLIEEDEEEEDGSELDQ